MAKNKEPKKRSWCVTAVVTYRMEFITSECTKDEAREHFRALAVEERDLDTLDWEVEEIERND